MSREPLREFARETEPRPGAVQRLVGSPSVLLRHLAVPTQLPVRRRVVRGVSPAAALLTLLGVAVATYTIAVLLRPRPLDAPLVSPERRLEDVTPHVRLAYQGVGHARGTDSAPRIQWEAGTLEVDVDSGGGVDLVVETSEGSARALGTAFTVRRDALGTTVEVAHGSVAVLCAGEAEQRLGTAESRACLPSRPAGMLGRARALRDAGAPSGDVLAAVDRGLGLASPSDPAAGELVVVRVEVLLEEGRVDEAIEAGRAYLRSGATSRRAAIEALCDPNSADPAP